MFCRTSFPAARTSGGYGGSTENTINNLDVADSSIYVDHELSDAHFRPDFRAPHANIEHNSLAYSHYRTAQGVTDSLGVETYIHNTYHESNSGIFYTSRPEPRALRIISGPSSPGDRAAQDAMDSLDVGDGSVYADNLNREGSNIASYGAINDPELDDAPRRPSPRTSSDYLVAQDSMSDMDDDRSSAYTGISHGELKGVPFFIFPRPAFGPGGGHYRATQGARNNLDVGDGRAYMDNINHDAKSHHHFLARSTPTTPRASSEPGTEASKGDTDNLDGWGGSTDVDDTREGLGRNGSVLNKPTLDTTGIFNKNAFGFSSLFEFTKDVLYNLSFGDSGCMDCEDRKDSNCVIPQRCVYKVARNAFNHMTVGDNSHVGMFEVYNIVINTADTASNPVASALPDPKATEPQTAQNSVSIVNVFVFGAGLGQFRGTNDPGVRGLARGALYLVQSHFPAFSTPLGALGLMELALHKHIVRCDTNIRMRHKHIPSPKKLLKRLSKRLVDHAATTLGHKNRNRTRALGPTGGDGLNDIEIGVENNIPGIETTKAATIQGEQLLEPLFLIGFRGERLRRPVTVSITTDGEPSSEKIDELKKIAIGLRESLLSDGYMISDISPKVSQTGDARPDGGADKASTARAQGLRSLHNSLNGGINPPFPHIWWGGW